MRADSVCDRVVIEHRHGRLQDDRTAVELCRHEVHGRTAHPDAMLERLALRVETGERGKQRGVDVQNAIGERIEERLRRRAA